MASAGHSSAACDECSAGSYQPLAGMSECWTCPGVNSTSLAGADSCILQLPCKPCIDRPKVVVRAVVHGLRTESFWLRVRRAMELAAAQMNVDFQFSMLSRFSTSSFKQAVNRYMGRDSPDVLLVTIPNDDVWDTIKGAAQSAHVFTFNSGADDYLQLGSKAHFSMDEHRGGYEAADHFEAAFAASGVTMSSCMVLNHEVGNTALDQRREGYKAACEEKGLTWLGEETTTSDDVNDTTAKVAGMISANSDQTGLGILLLGAASVPGAADAMEAAGDPANVKIGSFDADDAVYEGLGNGRIVFGIDQNEWLQGYLPVVISTLYVTTGNLMAPSLYPTGPKFVTQVPSDADAEKSVEAFPVCDCPWGAGFEELVDCSGGDVVAVGECPRTEGGCTVDCFDARSLKLRGVTHGHEADAFWFVVKAGADQAANDLRLQNFEMDLFKPPGSEGSTAFTDDLFAETIDAVASDPTVAGMFVSLHGPNVYDQVAGAASRMPVVTINSGSDVSASLNPEGGQILNHVGMDEAAAGESAGKRMADAGATNLLCVIHEASNSALDARCAGAAASMAAAGGNTTQINLVSMGIDLSNLDAIKAELVSILQGDPTIDALLCSGESTFSPALWAVKDLKEKGEFFLATFDSPTDLVQAIGDGWAMFGVDQQQYMQGYMAVLSLYMHLVAGQKLAEFVVQSGPFFITGAEPSKDTCIATTWAADVVGKGYLPHKDPLLVTGFPVCQWTGGCAESTSMFDESTGQCEPCPAGTYKTELMAQCETCPNGTSTNIQQGSSECTTCWIGSFAVGGDDECTSCPRGTFAAQERLSECVACEAPYTTVEVGQRTNASCVCPEGMYGDGVGYANGGKCLPCPEAMVCALGSDVRNIPGWGGAVAGYGGSVEYPKVEEGYMSRTSDPFEIYHCAIERWCPGGAPGACLPGRNPEKVACGECMPGTYAVDSGECLDCSTGDQTALALFLVLLVFVVLVAGVATIAVIVNRDIASQTHSKIAVVVLGGMMFSGLQVLTVYNAISLVWFQPMQAILKVISLISFDFTPLKTGCVWDGGGPVNYIVRQLVAPSLIPVVLVTLLVKRSRFRRDMEILPELNNAVGLLFSTLFIPITLSSLVPMIIDNHPGDSGKSVKSLPAILVMEDPDYLWLLWFGIIGLFIVPLPFLSICGYATWKYPSWMTAPDKTATRGMRAFRFLFSRFTPPSHQYGMVLLIRSFLICLVPVVLAGHKRVASQVIAMCFILCSFTIAQQQMRPWRDHFSNVLDGALNMCLLLLLVCGSMVSGIALEDFEVKVLGMMAFVTFLGLAVGSFVYLVMVYFVLAERFQVFICHHRAAAAAQARLIKLLLTKKGKKVYVDSDNLEELDTLFDTVKHRVEHVVVYLTSGTLSQPWCAGEISTAFDNPAVKKTAVRHPSFVPPSEEALSDLSAYIDLTNCTLSEYGISFARVADAFRALLGETTPSVIVDEAWLGAQRFHAVVEGILDGPSGAGARDTQLPSAEGMVVVSADPGDDEALAAMEIIVHKIPDDVASAAEVCCPADHLSGEEPALGGLVASSRAVVVLLSKDSLISTPQLITIVSAMKSGHRPEVIPLCTPSFVHPSCAYYSEVLPKVWPGDAKEAEGILRSFLNNDTLLFSALATEKAMDFQAAQVVGRMQGPKSGPVQGGQGSWEDPVPRVVLAEDSPPTFGHGDDDNSPEAAEPAAAVPSETQTPRVGI